MSRTSVSESGIDVLCPATSDWIRSAARCCPAADGDPADASPRTEGVLHPLYCKMVPEYRTEVPGTLHVPSWELDQQATTVQNSITLVVLLLL